MPTKEQMIAVTQRIGYLRSCTFRTVYTRLHIKFRVITGKVRKDDYPWSKLDWSAQRIILMNLVEWRGFDQKQIITVIDNVQSGLASGEWMDGVAAQPEV